MGDLEAMARAWATEHYGEAHKLSDTEIGWLVAFAARVDAEAVERCAKVCEATTTDERSVIGDFEEGVIRGMKMCAASIRSTLHTPSARHETETK